MYFYSSPQALEAPQGFSNADGHCFQHGQNTLAPRPTRLWLEPIKRQERRAEGWEYMNCDERIINCIQRGSVPLHSEA